MHTSFTDQWQTLLDENGKPLIGRVKFFNADSTQYKSIFYDMQGETQGDNPQYTLQDGRLEHQVFIGKGVYTCRVEKFLGTDVSSMRDHANDDTYWRNYKSFKIYGGAEEVEGGSDLAAGFCDTIAAMRLVNPSEHGVVSVIGYYSKEDGIEPRTYVWVEGNSDAEDYGSTIVSSVTGYTSAGRWKLCESPIVCATTFGVFPNRASTITPSELTTKATALAQYARLSPVCTAIQFNRGNYEFAEGARLSFTKKVITGASVVSGSTIKFGMHVEDGQTPSGTIEIAFIGGLEIEQKSPICTDDYDSYTRFSFGAGFVRTSWLNNVAKHITASVSYEGLTIILDKSSNEKLFNDGCIVKNWNFKGCHKQNYNKVDEPVIFYSCSFEGECIQADQVVGFYNCGTLYQDNICANEDYIKDGIIWGSSGHIKSKGTSFICHEIRMTKAYTGAIDNSCVKAIGGDDDSHTPPTIERPMIKSNFEITFKYLDRDWNLIGKIGFENSDTLYASQYYDFSDCVDYSLANPKTIDLESGSYSYTIDTTDVSETRLFAFKNGTLTLTKTGTGSVKDVVSVEDTTLIVDNSFSQISLYAEGSDISGVESYIYSLNIDLELKDCNITAGSSGAYVKSCNAVDTKFIGDFRFVNDDDAEFKQDINNCHFNSQITFFAVDSGVKVKCSITNCSFSISNSGTPISAIAQTINAGGSFANESENKYTIEENLYIGDAFLLPTKKATFRLTSSTDGITTPMADWDVSVGSLSVFGIVGSDNYNATASKFSDYSFISSKLFHFGNFTDFVLKATPMTQVENFYHGQGNYSQILPISDYIHVNGASSSGSNAVYRVFGDSLEPPYAWGNIMPTILWLVEVEKM